MEDKNQWEFFSRCLYSSNVIRSSSRSAFCSGLLTPGVEVLRSDLVCFDPGEATLVLPAVFAEDLVILAPLDPL